jgi:hypothetical protein
MCEALCVPHVVAGEPPRRQPNSIARAGGDRLEFLLPGWEEPRVIVEGRGVSRAIISKSVTKVRYTLFLFSRSTCVILLSIARVCLCAASQCPYLVECFFARLQQPRQTVLMPQHEGTPMKQKLIRATELAEFVYCSRTASQGKCMAYRAG